MLETRPSIEAIELFKRLERSGDWIQKRLAGSN